MPWRLGGQWPYWTCSKLQQCSLLKFSSRLCQLCLKEHPKGHRVEQVMARKEEGQFQSLGIVCKTFYVECLISTFLKPGAKYGGKLGQSSETGGTRVPSLQGSFIQIILFYRCIRAIHTLQMYTCRHITLIYTCNTYLLDVYVHTYYTDRYM